MADLVSKWGSRLNAFEELTQKWKSVGLGALQKTALDADALLLTANKESLAQGRKALGGKTKDFAALPNEKKLSDFGSLLKGYQGYVDELTKFLTDAERCYFNLNGVVQGMVDPYPLMDRFTKEKNTLLEYIRGYEESEGLRRIIKDREAELLELHNQEVTIKKLRAQVAETELLAMAKVEKSASSNQEELTSLLTQWKMREYELQQELQRALSEQRRAEGEIKELGGQLASLRTKYSALEELRDSETAALAAELEEAAIQGKLAERELSKLRVSEKELKKALSSATTSSEGLAINAAVDISDVQYLSALNQELQQTKDECNNLRVRCSLLEKEVEKFTAGTRVASTGTSVASASLVQLQKSLEAARDEASKLADDVSNKERVIGSMRSRLETAQSDLIARDAELTVLRAKVKKLEEEKQPLLTAVRDLERTLAGRKDGTNTNTKDGAASQQFDLESVLRKDPAPVAPPQPSTPTFSTASDEAFFAVTSQRDRLRQRLLALEEAASQEVEQLQAQLKAIKDERDELLLQQRAAAGPSTYTLSMPPPSAAATSQAYYTPHGKKGRQQVVSALDTLTMLLYKHVLSDVWMRRVFLGYLSMLHIFVFVDLFYQTSGFF